MPYFLIGKRELREKPELGGKLACLLVEDSFEDRGSLSLGNRGLSKEKANTLVREKVEKLKNNFLAPLNRKSQPEGFMRLIFPACEREFVQVLHTFVSKKFRKKGVAKRLTYTLFFKPPKPDTRPLPPLPGTGAREWIALVGFFFTFLALYCDRCIIIY